jgi:putative ABC transport system permease protein
MLERMVEIVVLGIRNLRRNKLRTLLTTLGIVFGVGSVISMLAVGAGARAEILSRIQELGIRNIIVNSVKPPLETRASAEGESWILRYGLTFRDRDHLLLTCPAIDRILPVNQVKSTVSHGSRNLDATVLGVLPDHLRELRLRVNRGRTIADIDDEAANKVCVVRSGLLDQLATVEDPLGMVLKIGGQPFEIVGILDDQGFHSHTRKALSLDDRSSEIYIPYETSMRTFGTLTAIRRSGSEEINEVELDQMIVQTRGDDDVFPTARIIAAALGSLHEKKDYEIVVPLELLQQREQTQKVFNLVMVIIAGISLVVGGIGIVNIMLATITERTREIGIRRALGATRGDILIQFLLETVVIAAVGGLLGCALGTGGAIGLAALTEWKTVVSPNYVLISLVISCTVGVVFGVYPARRAAALDPIAALRYE